jgi:acetyltransferase-like isoleucine patch superfamily enzyme
MSSIRFIANKVRNMSPSEIIYSEIEAWLLTIFDLIPGFVGVLCRFPVYKILFKRLGGLPVIQHGVTLVHTRNLVVGRHFGVNSGSYINALGGVTIGDYVLIGSNVTISAGKHEIEGTEPPVFSRPSVPQHIRIEDDVWIAANVVIMPGITLAKGTVVGAGAVVTKDTIPYSVVAGAPAKVVRMRNGQAVPSAVASPPAARDG